MQLEGSRELCTGDHGVNGGEVYRAWIRVHKILRLFWYHYIIFAIKKPKSSPHPSLYPSLPMNIEVTNISCFLMSFAYVFVL